MGCDAKIQRYDEDLHTSFLKREVPHVIAALGIDRYALIDDVGYRAEKP